MAQSPSGVVSARGRDINSGPYDDYLQIDAPINRGNSGGPLFNNRGEVIGVNSDDLLTQLAAAWALALRFRRTWSATIVAELESNGKVTRGWLGVKIQPLTDEIAESLGLTQTQWSIGRGCRTGQSGGPRRCETR